MAETKKTTKAPVKRKPRPIKAVQFTVWSASGGLVPENAVKEIEDAIQRSTLALFNDGVRLLTQTSRV